MSDSHTTDTLSSCDTEEYDLAKHQVPKLSEPEVDSVLAAARHVFEEKLDKYLDVEFPDKAQQKLLKKGPLTKLNAFYEEYAMEPDKIPFINFNTDKTDELKALMHSKDFEAIGDLVLQDFIEDVERYREEIENSWGQHSSFGEDEEEDDDDEEGYQGYEGDVPLLYRTSPSTESDRGLEPIEEEDEGEDGPVFL